MQKTDYPIILTRHLDALKAEWARVSAEVVESCRGACPEGAEVADELAHFLKAPGKFVRSSLFLFGYSLGGKKPDAKIIRLAITFELLHTGLLIEDDIMDQDDFRRGVPTIHNFAAAYHARHKMRGSAKHFGESIAINIGLALIAKAGQIWSAAAGNGMDCVQARAIIDKMYYDVCWGQYLDVMTPASAKVPSRVVVAKIMEEKTSNYTIKNPLQAGAAMGGVKEKDRKWINEFGKQLGIAFQVADDILGVYGDPKVTGKSVYSDIYSGKATFLVISALESADAKDKKTIADFYTAHERDHAKIEVIKKIFDKYGVHDKAVTIANEYKERALAEIEKSDIPDKAQSELQEFSRFVVERNK